MNLDAPSFRITLVPILTAAFASIASAQWPTSSSANLAVADRTGDQVTPKVDADGQGGTWISWFDHASGNYDVYVQHLDARGVETFAHNGVLVSSNPSNSSLVDWDLLADASGGCVIVFSDARAGSDLDVYAYRLDAAGNQMWGANGVTLSNKADFEPAPRVAQLTDGTFAVVWSRSPNSGDATIRMQRLDANGAQLFAFEGLSISGAVGEDLGLCNVVAADSGSYIVSWVRDISTFAAPRHIRARKFDSNGAPLWPAFTAVYDQNAIPIAHDPIVQADGNGGAWFAWHRAIGSTFDALVQHLDTNGAEVFPHNGALVSTEASRSKFSPSLAQLPGGDVIVAFNKRNTAQSLWASCAQRISASGVRLWTDNGVELAPYDAITESFERAVRCQDGAIVMWFEQANATPPKKVRAQRVDGAGNVLWAAGGIEVCSTLSAKDDIEVTTDDSGVARAAWHDERSGNPDIFAQDVNPDGTLGPATPGVEFCAGDGLDPNVTTPCPCANSGASGNGCASSFNAAGAHLSAHGLVAHDDVVLDGSGMNASGVCVFLQGDAIDPSAFVFGDGITCTGGTLLRLRGVALSGGTASFPVAPETITLSARGGVAVGSGAVRSYTVYYRNAAAAFCPPATFNTSSSYRITW